MNGEPVQMRACVDCGRSVTNPRRGTKRCRACFLAKSRKRARPEDVGCADCGVELASPYSLRCPPCAGKASRVAARPCVDCGRPLSPNARARCRPCHNANAKVNPPNPLGAPKAERNGQWRGGRHHTNKGYVYIYVGYDYPNHRRGYVLEHRFAMEQKLGRTLTAQEIVHHRNGVRDDNREENLEVMANHGEHLRRHHRFILPGSHDFCPNCGFDLAAAASKGQ